MNVAEQRDQIVPPSLPSFQSAWGRSMRPKFGPILRLLFGRLASQLVLDPEAIQKLREASRDATLVYVMPSASLIDYLLMNGVALQQDLPLAQFANDVPMILAQPPSISFPAFFDRLKTLFRPPALQAREECRHLGHALDARQPVLLFLNKAQVFSVPTKWSVLVWEELIRANRRGNHSIRLVPITFLWGRRAGRIGRTATDVLFGDTEAPGYLRKIIIYLRSYRQCTLRIGTPSDLSPFLEKEKSTRDEIVAKKLRRTFSSYLLRERRLLAGPPTRSRKRIIRSLLRDPDLSQLMTSLARRKGMDRALVVQEAEKILWEMIADFNNTAMALSYRVVRWLWSRLYDQVVVNKESLERFKQIARDFPTIVIPSHKSHMDYVLLSAIFYENDMTPPHIASGINLKFWPMGPIFRRDGAFFIRRQIAGDLLYARLLALYVRWLVRAGYTQEFYIEGGRSRTGKLIFPKHGLLSMQVDAVLNGTVRDLYVVPIGITYEKIVEEGSYQAELTGSPKEKESVRSMFASRKLLRRKHGSAYVRFGEPISVRSYFGVPLGERISPKVQKTRLTELAHEVIRGISRETIVTTTSLAATALLATSEGALLESVLYARVRKIQSYLKQVKIPLTPEVEEIETYLPAFGEYAESRRWITLELHDNDRLWRIRSERRIVIDYYKNMILHYLLPPIFTAMKETRAGADFSFVQEILANEFLIPKNAHLETNVAEADSLLFASLATNYLESYFLVAKAIERGIALFTGTNESIRPILRLGEQLLALGEITRPEAISSANIQSALTYFHKRNQIDPSSIAPWFAQAHPWLSK